MLVELYDELNKQHFIRRGGFAPALTDEELLTMEICGAFFKLHTDTELFGYFCAHYRHFFPRLKDRSSFVRQAANLWQVKRQLWQQILRRTGQIDVPVQIIDTLPLPVCAWTRGGRRDKCFPQQADYGHCAAKKLNYYGFKLGLRVSAIGMITHCPLLSARAHDINHLPTLVEDFAGLCPADKGFIDAFRQDLLQQRQQVWLVTTPKSNQITVSTVPPVIQKACRRLRKIVETVGSHLTERFQIDQIRVYDIWHLQSRIIRKVLSHTIAVFLNLQFNRPPLQLDGLVRD